VTGKPAQYVRERVREFTFTSSFRVRIALGYSASARLSLSSGAQTCERSR
jgi:hypothetical protein